MSGEYCSRSSIDERRKMEKERLKALETPEEKRARRLAKKTVKERKRKAAMGWAESHLGYTDQDNPYNDPNLSQKFVWHKKNSSGQDEEGSMDARLELEKLKVRRSEREREREQREIEREFLQRQKEAEYYKEWSQHEDAFHLRQVILRSRIRIQDGRAKPIDLLARYIFAFDRFSCMNSESALRADDGDDEERKCIPSALSSSLDDCFSEDFRDDMFATHQHPITHLQNLSIRDLEDLLADIDTYRKLDKNGTHAEFWSNVGLLVKDLHSRLFEESDTNCERTHASDLLSEQTIKRSSINKAVSDDILNILRRKKCVELGAMESEISEKICSNASNVDIGYWESLLCLVRVFKARARLSDLHNEFSNLKLDRLRREHSKTTHSYLPNGEKRGTYSPTVRYLDRVDAGIYVVDENEDNEKLRMKRNQVIGTGFVEPDVEDAFEKKAREGITGQSVVAVDVVAQTPTSPAEANVVVVGIGCNVEEIPVELEYLWSDKYRPRKPRFFNKVHTGYDWNQYNKKHYDTDNPPPKTVQGYKFNIFFPDLIDDGSKTTTPTYDLKICDECRDFAILRFHSGPPYEDIAFKIVNKEWDFSHKHGFRCQFQNGIFQLWFHFRKWKYRR